MTKSVQARLFTLSKPWFKEYDSSTVNWFMDKLHYDHIILEYASKLQSTANANYVVICPLCSHLSSIAVKIFYLLLLYYNAKCCEFIYVTK